MLVCSAYFRKEMIYIICSHQTLAGFWVNGEPWMVINKNQPFSIIGEAVISVLKESKHRVPIPEKSPEVLKAICEYANVKAWGTFVKSAAYISIRLEESEVIMTPGSKEKSGGYSQQVDKAKKCHLEPEEVGRLLVKQSELCL